MLVDDELSNRLNKPLKLARKFVNPHTKRQFELLGSINLKGSAHYNVTLVNPYLQDGIWTKGIYFYDGLNKGHQIEEINWNQAYKLNKPYIALYQCLN